MIGGPKTEEHKGGRSRDAAPARSVIQLDLARPTRRSPAEAMAASQSPPRSSGPLVGVHRPATTYTVNYIQIRNYIYTPYCTSVVHTRIQHVVLGAAGPSHCRCTDSLTPPSCRPWDKQNSAAGSCHCHIQLGRPHQCKGCNTVRVAEPVTVRQHISASCRPRDTHSASTRFHLAVSVEAQSRCSISRATLTSSASRSAMSSHRARFLARNALWA